MFCPISFYGGLWAKKSFLWSCRQCSPLGENRGGALRTPYFGQKMDFWLKNSLDLMHVVERVRLSRHFTSSCHLVVGAEGEGGHFFRMRWQMSPSPTFCFPSVKSPRRNLSNVIFLTLLALDNGDMFLVLIELWFSELTRCNCPSHTGTEGTT